MQPTARFGLFRALSCLIALGSSAASGCAVSEASDEDNPFVVDGDSAAAEEDGQGIDTIDDGDPASDGEPAGDGDDNPDASVPGDGRDGTSDGSDGLPGDGSDGDTGGPDAGPMDTEDAGVSGPMCTPQNCNDGIACTVDSCGSNDSCTHTPNNALCGANQECKPTGCVAVAPVCSESPCSLVQQCGCASGQACYPGNDFSPECAPAGTEPETGACLDSSDCAAGMICLEDPADPLFGACYRMCKAHTDCRLSSSRCSIRVRDAAGSDQDLFACTIP